jgi:branched-chain amino acid transport system substrate-binding protein
MKKSYLAVTVLITLALVLAACSQTSTPTTTQAPVSQTTAATETKPQTKEITIGATLPLSGEGAPYGTLFLNGLTLGIKKINDAGGVDGITINLISMDDAADAETSVTQMQKLVQVNNALVVSSAYSAPPLAQAPIADQTKTVLFNGGGFAPELRGAGKYLFNDVPLSTDEGKVILTYAYKDLGLRKLGLIIASSYSKATTDFMEQFWTNLGGKVVIEARHDVNATDLRSQIELLKNAAPDAVLLLNDGNDTILTLTQAQQVNYHPQWLGFAGQMIDQIMSLPSADGMVADSVVYNPDADFVTAYKAAYNSDPNFYVANYYDQTIILAQAIDYCIKNNKPITGENLHDAIYAIRTFTGVNGTFTFLNDGTIARDMEVVKVENGKQTVIKTISADELSK